jgi:hypothetical protein
MIAFRYASACVALALACNGVVLANNKGARLISGEALIGTGDPDFIQSPDGRFKVVMQADCNLVLYKGQHALWASGTDRKGSQCTAIMQSDGNLVVYNGNHSPLWATGTNGHSGVSAVIQNDGNFVLYQNAHPMWASNTQVPEPVSKGVTGHPVILRPGEALLGSKNDFLQASGTIITFRMQPDCNLVLYEGTAPRWASNTNGNRNDCRAIMQSDGNLVIYKDDGRVAWASGTQGRPGASLVLQSDRNAVIYFGSQHQAVWATHTEYPRRAGGGSGGSGPFPGCVPVRTDHDCYVFVMMCKDIYACSGLNSNLGRPEKADTPYVCGACTPKISF